MTSRYRGGRLGPTHPFTLLAIAFVAAAVLSAATLKSVLAAKGVSIDLGRVTIGEPLRGGDRFDLPRFTVSNPGDETATYVVSVGGLEGDIRAPETGWFTFAPSEFTLEPGGTQVVQARLQLPVNAPAGAYAGLVRAQLTTVGAGALVGGAAAAHVRFDVASNPVAGSASPGVVLQSVSPWGYAAGLAALVAIALSVLGRRYRISIGRR